MRSSDFIWSHRRVPGSGVRNSVLRVSTRYWLAASAIRWPMPGSSISKPMIKEPTTRILCRWMRCTEAGKSRPLVRLNFLPSSRSPSGVGDSKPMKTPRHPAFAANARSSSSSAKLMVAWAIHCLCRLAPARARNNSLARATCSGRVPMRLSSTTSTRFSGMDRNSRTTSATGRCRYCAPLKVVTLQKLQFKGQPRVV